jgi:cyanate permease
MVLIKNRPEDIGQVPDGEDSSSAAAVKADYHPESPSPGWRTGRILKTPTIWMIAGFAFADALVMGTVVAHQIAYIQDIGFNPMVAASVASFQSIFSIAGGLIFGALCLKLNMRHLAASAFLLQILGMVILLTTQNLALIYVYAAFTGLSLGAVFTAMATFVGAYYPREHYARVLGIVLPFYVVAQSISALAVGAIFDAIGRYTPAFGILAVCSAGGLVCTLLARPPKQLSYVNSSISDG